MEDVRFPQALQFPARQRESPFFWSVLTALGRFKVVLARLRTIILERSMKLVGLHIQLDLLQPIGTRLPLTSATFCHAD